MAEESDNTPRPLAEISHGPSAFEAFLDRNQKGMIVLGIALVAATAGWIVVRGIKDGAEKSAGGILTKSEGIAELQSMLKDHPDTAAAGSAQLVIAAKQWEEGDQDAAIETLRAFITAKPEHPGIPTARASLASRLLVQGKSDEAATQFQEIANDPKARFLAPYALTSLGDIHKAAGRLDEAEQAYKRAQNDFGTNPLSKAAADHLKLLRFKPPVEIEPPPAPAPKEGEAAPAPAPEDAALPKELDGPLGNILIGESTPPPVETPAEEALPAEPANEQPAPPAEAPEAPPAEGKSN